LTALNRARLRQGEVAKAEYAAGAASSSRGASFPEAGGHSRIERAVAMLSPDLREVLLLVSLERMTYDEVAEIIEVPVVTMLARLTRARDELRIHFNGAAVRQPRSGTNGRPAPHLRLVK
jgi:RNA polymerase sigma-70 factor (ECF subfamily)